MPFASGPNNINDSIVFTYDTGDAVNSYKGEPTTNYWNGNPFSIYNSGATNVRNSTDVAPPLPGYEVVKVTADTIGSYGQCILWNATYPNNNVATITNSIYAYLVLGDYVQVGQHWFPWYYGTQKNIAKNQWVRISETYTINEGNSYGNAALTYSTNGIAYFAMPQYEYVSHVTPFIGANQTRSTTQGLLDISGNNNTINLVNMTYNAAALPVFDGTDDYTDVGSWFNYQIFTIDLWVRPGATQTTYADIFDNNHTGTQNFVCQQNVNNVNQYEFAVINNGSASGTGLFNLTANTWVNLTFTFDGTRARFFRNGVLELNGSSITGPINYSSPNLRLGGWYNGGRNWNGQIAKFSTYNRVLSGTEIANNYNQNKTRFNL